ncbi:MAG: competence/damage-inducible protein A [Elusimicrobia bacterium]|nr:competence/damage-inducible protein A [Elusimicrobiota bacterium]
MTRVEIVCVGTELLSGKVNTHMAFLAPCLQGLGLRIGRESSVGDSIGEIRAAVGEAFARADVVLVTGGLGPTFDDLTREGTAEALGLRLTYRPQIFESIRRRFLRYGRTVPEENKRQAHVIEGATVLRNRVGSAPGQRVVRSGKAVFLLPGPPAEMQPMMREHVVPYLRRTYSNGQAAAKTILRLSGVSESAADERLDPLYRSAGRRGVEFTILSEPGLVHLHITAVAGSRREAERRVAAAAAAARRRVGEWVFGVDDDTLESVAGARLARRGWTLAVAESCTGGLLSRRLTKVAGASKYYLGGVVCYSDGSKVRELGVSRDTLHRSGAVSPACAREMAEGARERWGSDCAVSITGIAGPGGGTKAKPVGLTYFACARRGAATKVLRVHLPGDRDAVQQRATGVALALLLRSL